MPLSKRPRKRYRPRPVMYTAVDPRHIDAIIEQIDAAEYSAYVALQTGTLDFEQLEELVDVLNLGTAVWMLRSDILGPKFGDGTELLNAATPALCRMRMRCRKLRGQDCDRFAATAEELRAIQSAVPWCCDILRDRYRVEPRRIQRISRGLAAALGSDEERDAEEAAGDLPIRMIDEKFVKRLVERTNEAAWMTIHGVPMKQWRRVYANPSGTEARSANTSRPPKRPGAGRPVEAGGTGTERGDETR